jgi:hypothetical protein
MGRPGKSKRKQPKSKPVSSSVISGAASELRPNETQLARPFEKSKLAPLGKGAVKPTSGSKSPKKR